MSTNDLKSKKSEPKLQEFNLRKLKYTPDSNPLLVKSEVALRTGLVRTGGYQDLINTATGEVESTSVIHKRKVLDDEHFVKMFSAGIAASFELNRTAQRVLTAVLAAYQRSPMKGGYVDWVELYWFGEGLEGHDIGMSEKTFQRGLKDLLARKFLAPRSPTTFWTNPHLFFRGSRALFITELVREGSSPSAELPSNIAAAEIPY